MKGLESTSPLIIFLLTTSTFNFLCTHVCIACVTCPVGYRYSHVLKKDVPIYAEIPGMNSPVAKDSPVVELSIVCDEDFGKLFGFDVERINDYWINQIKDLEVTFQTLSYSKIRFSMVPGVYLMGTNYQAFNEDLNFNGFSDLKEISDKFGTLAYNDKKLNQSDLILLVTGTKGIQSFVSGRACNISQANKKLSNIVVLRATKTKWHRHLDLARSIGNALGLQSDPVDFSCSKGYIMSKKTTAYRFSECSDSDIDLYLSTKESLCLRKLSSKTHIKNNDVLPSLSTESHCMMEYGSNNLVTTKYVGSIWPIYNSPCGTNKFCFRGRCLPKGVVFTNVKANQCLISTEIFANDDQPKLALCPEIAEKSDEFMLRDKGNGQLYLAVVYFNINRKDKCLTVNEDNSKIVFSECPDIMSSTFLWEMIKIGNSSYQIFHKESNKCVAIDDKMNTILAECNANSNAHMVWNVSENNFPFRMAEREDVSTEQPLLQHQGDGTDFEDDTIMSTASPLNTTSNDKPFVTFFGSNIFVLGSSIALLVFAVIIIIAVYKWKYVRKSKKHPRYTDLLKDDFYKGAVEKINPDLNVALQANLLPFNKQWEFPEDRLKLGKQLGAGTFGAVVEAEAIGIFQSEARTTVAVKTVNDTTNEVQTESLISELKILSHLGTHINIVNLLGACTNQLATRRRLYVILEFCKHGNLRTYLHRHRHRFLDQTIADVDSTDVTSLINVMTINEVPLIFRKNQQYSISSLPNTSPEIETQDAQTLKTSDLVCWAFQIARGMEFLSFKRILHGDLASRNCLLAENNVVKICDFGLSRKLQQNYYYNYKKDTDGALLPFKWMAIESIRCGLFSSASDCWSFGVVLWELFTLGDTPYPGFSVGHDIYNYLSKRNRMEKPLYAPSRVYDVMLQCWLENPAARPTFTQLVEKLQIMMKEPLKDYYFQLESEYHNRSRGHHSKETDVLLKIGNKEIIFDSDHTVDIHGYLLAKGSDSVAERCKKSKKVFGSQKSKKEVPHIESV